MLNNELSQIDVEELDDHLESCSDCRATLAEAASHISVPAEATPWKGRLPGTSTFQMLAMAAARSIDQYFPDGTTGEELIEDRVQPPAIDGYDEWCEIGRGGMGVVFRARHRELDRLVAVKLIVSRGRLAGRGETRSLSEARSLARINHPNVVRLLYSGRIDSMTYLVMEYIDGGTLQEQINLGPVAIRDAARIVRDLALAVAEVHSLGIVHRDIKPANVLLTRSRDADTLVPKLVDFGIARIWEDDASLTRTGAIVGTPNYMAPEQTGYAPSCGQPGPATDIHALGGVLYALLTGKPPYEGDNVHAVLFKIATGHFTPCRSLRSDVPADLESIVARCLEYSPRRRFSNARDLAEDLDCFLEGRPVKSRPVSTLVRVAKWSRRRPVQAGVVVLGILAIIAGVIATNYHVQTLRLALNQITTEQQKTQTALVAASEARDRTRVALSTASKARSRAQDALDTLTQDTVQRMLDQGAPLNEADFRFLKKIQAQLEEPFDDEKLTRGVKEKRATSLQALGLLFQRVGRTGEAQKCLRDAVAIWDDIRVEHPEDDGISILEISSLKHLYDLVLTSSSPSEAVDLAQKMVELRRPLATRSRDHESMLVRHLHDVGTALRFAGRKEEGFPCLRQAIDIAEKLRKEHPGNPEHLLSEVITKRNYAFYLRETGRHEEAFKAYREPLELWESHRQQIENNPTFNGERAVIMIALMESSILMKRPQEGLPYIARLLDLAHDQFRRFPQDEAMKTHFVRAGMATWQICRSTNHCDQAEPLLREALAIAQARVNDSPAILANYEPLMSSLFFLGDTMLALGKFGESLELFCRMEPLGVTLITASSQSPPGRQLLTKSRRGQGIALVRLKRHDEALTAFHRSVEFATPSDLGSISLDVARCHLDSGKLEEARAAATAALNDEQHRDEATRVLQEIERRSSQK